MNRIDQPAMMVSDRFRQPVVYTAFAITNDANNPAVFEGHISDVQRLITAGGTPFLRFTFIEPIALPGTRRPGAVAIGVEGVAEADDLSYHVMQTVPLVDAGGDVFDAARDMDFVLRDGGVATTAAGYKVSLTVTVDRMERR